MMKSNYACMIGVSDLCGKLILEGLCCIYQPCEKFVPCFAVLSHSCRLAGSSPPQPLSFLSDVMDEVTEDVSPSGHKSSKL